MIRGYHLLISQYATNTETQHAMLALLTNRRARYAATCCSAHGAAAGVVTFVTLVSRTEGADRIALGDKIRPLDRVTTDWSGESGGVGEDDEAEDEDEAARRIEVRGDMSA